jgi:hypothetical protein
VGKTVVEFDGESRRQLTRAIYIYRGLGTLSRLRGGLIRTTYFREITTYFREIIVCTKRGVAEAFRGSTPDISATSKALPPLVIFKGKSV